MRAFLLSLALMMTSLIPAKANDAAIQGVIDAQVAAFLKDDFETAFSYASPSIQGIFKSPQRFGQMVRQGYPMVWRPASVRYLDSEERGGQVIQTVQMTDANGVPHLLAYAMIETAEGWKIAGVQLLRDPSLSV